MAKRKKPTRYTVTDGEMVLYLEPAEEGGFCITCPFDPSLITEAETLEEAFEMAYDAAEGLKVGRANLRRRLSADAAGTEVPPAKKGGRKRKAASA